MNWQPIDTAPKDGTRFLAIHQNGRIELRHIEFMEGVNGAGEEIRIPGLYPGGAGLAWFSHWMPLPTPPIGEQMTEAEEAADNYKWRAQASAMFMWIASRAQDAQGPTATDLDRAAAIADIRRAATEWMLHGKRPKDLEI